MPQQDPQFYSMASAFRDLSEYNRKRAAGEIVSVPTGLPFLDKNMEIEHGNLVVIAARPKSGKTSLAINMACSQAVNDIARPAVFSLEMSKREITRKMLACVSGVDLGSIKHAHYSEMQQDKISDAEFKLATSSLQLVDDTGLTLNDLYGIIGGFKVDFGTNVIYIDQLSHLSLGMGSIREQFVRGTKGLKQMARELNVVIVLLCQVRRADDDGHKPPRMRHLKESGSIEEDADIILMPWRPNSEGDCPIIQYGGREVNMQDKAVIYCRAYREGEIWQELVYFDGPTTTFGRCRA